MDGGIAHFCRRCEEPLGPAEPVDAQHTAASVEDVQPAPPAQQAVREKHKKRINSAENHAQPSGSGMPEQSTSAAGSEEVAASKSTGVGDAGNSGGSPMGAAGGKLSPSPKTGNFSQSIGTIMRLDEIYNGEVEPTHPMCEHCTDTLIEKVDKEIFETESELRDYKAYLEKTEAEGDNEPSLEELRAELERVEAEDERLKVELEGAIAERDAAFRERDLVAKEHARLEHSYSKEVKEYMELKHGWFAAKAEIYSLKNRAEYQEEQSRILSEIQVPKKVFRIKLKGRIGIINGFRLGKTTSIQTPWEEINFAWGEAVFLLDYLARMFNFEFEDYVLMPFKDKSRIETLERRSKPMSLYMTTEYSVEQVTSYDRAQLAFAECVCRLEREIRRKYKNFRLDHPISEGRIYEHASGTSHVIRFGTNTYESWTRALRLMLKNLDSMLNLQAERMRNERPQKTNSKH